MTASGPDTVPAVAVTNVSKRYGRDVLAVDDVSLAVRKGEFLTLLGPSGSGKTTLLKMIAGFLAPTSGSLAIEGRDVSRVPAHKRNIGMVFQNYALFPHLSVADNLAFPLKMRRVRPDEIKRRVQAALELVRLGGLGGRLPKQLSGGQQQRVALARAVVYEPSVLLMDEPLGALDKRLREELQLEIKALHQDLGITVLYVTHDQEEALVMSDRIAIFREGTIEQLGSGEDLYRRPTSTFVAAFMGESNILHGEVGVGGPAPTVVVDGMELRGTCVPGRQVQHGSQVAMIVRPEDCHVAARSATNPGWENAVDGSVRQVIYLGAATKVQVEVGSNVLTVRADAHPDHDIFQTGAPVTVRWTADDAVVVSN